MSVDYGNPRHPVLVATVTRIRLTRPEKARDESHDAADLDRIGDLLSENLVTAAA
jgi:hypothetical protein